MSKYDRKRQIKRIQTHIPLQWSPWKAAVTFLLAIGGFLYAWRSYDPVTAIMRLPFLAGLVLLSLFRWKGKAVYTKKEQLILHLIFTAASLTMLYSICIDALNLTSADISASLPADKVLLNYVCAVIVFSVMMGICGNYAAAFALSAMILVGLSTMNGLVYMFRGKELGITDFLSVRTALAVASGYHIFLPLSSFLILSKTALMTLVLLFLPRSPSIGVLRRRLVWLLVGAFALIGLIFGAKDIKMTAPISHASRYDGYFLHFYLGIRESVPKEPEGYSRELLAQLEEEYGVAAGETENRSPNIIVIMNESYADLDVFPQPPNYSQPVAPFFQSLQENAIKGYALASVFGGNTPNSEFEFLTSHSMAFFPNPTYAVPYQQHLSEGIYALPWLMRSLGYECFATHPFLSVGWSRPQNYRILGFNGQSFMEDYPQEKLLRGYISDQEMYEYVLKTLRDQEREKPLFLFGVTMQNHGAYDAPDYESTVLLENLPGMFPQTEQWLTLINESDRALAYLIGELEKEEEDTVLLFFGDHQPGFEPELYLHLNGGTAETLDDNISKYVVPFLLWANYDIEEYTVERTSLNYLAGRLLEVAGIDLPPYYRFLRDQEAVVPYINAFGYYSQSQGKMLPISEADGLEAETIQLLQNVQYNNIFDRKHRSELFFSAYNAGS